MVLAKLQRLVPFADGSAFLDAFCQAKRTAKQHDEQCPARRDPR